jgi:adenine-specific DNA-methyltransferase
MKLIPQENLNKPIDKALLKHRPLKSEIELFKAELINLLDHIDITESEEYNKNLVGRFLEKGIYKNKNFINTKGRQDLVIHTGNDNKTTVGVIIEAKRPTNKGDWFTADKPNSKALQELVLYYLRERIECNNIDIKYLIATNINEWYIIESSYFKKLFYDNKEFVKNYKEWRDGKKDGIDTGVFYKDIAKPFIDKLQDEIPCIYFNLSEDESNLRNKEAGDNKKLIALLKILSPYNLLKVPFANDSNELDNKFYSELLHIIGLSEYKEGSKKLINRKKKGERNEGSLLENTIIQLENHDQISRLDRPSQYGETYNDRLYNIALELVITWVNRILFLKLLEAQLINYHKDQKTYSFLSKEKISNFTDLDNLFFQILAKKIDKRNNELQKVFEKVPYLNSSLFESTELERKTLFINGLDDRLHLPIIGTSVLKNSDNKTFKGSMPSLDYLFNFLEAYDFSSEGVKEIQEDNKTLINASVLGLIFEKINGYKDGSFFTPGFITMYMCKETIRHSVVQKFNEVNGWECKDYLDLYNKIEDKIDANKIINSLKICDPAVGSGHFLVSALNEIIAIKSDLKVLMDKDNRILRDYDIEVINDELIITDDNSNIFEYKPLNKESQRVQETLFHEKQVIIENCLFGVDINPNSVKICRLRLWIELLKNAYYKQDINELETLPNIDINIKLGNSLISRFALNSDLKQSLKNKDRIKEYKASINQYQNALDKDDKLRMEDLIQKIKNEFSVAIGSKDIANIQKLESKFYTEYERDRLFEVELNKSQKLALEKRKKEAEEEIKLLKDKIEEIKNHKIYDNAFEWRFEFPEVLNDEGDFLGFDVVIGNPPYKLIQPNNTTLYEISHYKSFYKFADFKIDLFHLFYQLGIKLLRDKAILNYITPSSILNNVYSENLRNYLIHSNEILTIAVTESKVFEDADVHTGIFQLRKNSTISIDHEVNLTTNLIGVLNKKEEYRRLRQVEFNSLPGKVWNLLIDESNISLVSKISNNPKLHTIAKINRGLITGDREKYFAPNKDTLKHTEILSGSDINRYFFNSPSEYVLFERPKSAGGCWDKEVHFAPFKVCIRQIGSSPTATLIQNPFAVTGNVFTITNSNLKILKSILGLINSKCIKYYWKLMFSDFKTTFPQVTIFSLDQIPVPSLDNILWNQINGLVDEILIRKEDNHNYDTTALEKQIDALVYELYRLTREEIGIIENSTNEHKDKREIIGQ